MERSSYQSIYNVAPKGILHLSSVPHGCTAHTGTAFFLPPSDHSEMCWVCEDLAWKMCPPKCQRHDDKTIHDFLLCGTCEFLDDGQSDEERLAELAGPPTLGRSAHECGLGLIDTRCTAGPCAPCSLGLAMR